MKFTVMALCILSASFCAWAEKADASKEVEIMASKAVYSSVKDSGTFSGNIVLTRGTLVMKGGKLDLTKDASGYQSFVLVGEDGKKASFRQKSDNGDDEWIEGEGARIEYSDQSEEMKIFSQAHLRRMNGKKVMEEVEGEAIVYDSLKELFQANNSASGSSTAGAGRIKVVIQAKEAAKETAKEPTKDSSASTKK
jgi:lipopolysaccharide export system protein LptA